MTQIKSIQSIYYNEVDKNCPLPEYPRPQMRRDSYLNLNGVWDYAILNNAEAFSGYQGKILVPFSPESLLSGVCKTVEPDDVLYYRRSFILPEGFIRDRVLLNFGAVDYSAEIYINDKPAGAHKGGYFPFSLDITTLLEDGENEISLTVTDPSDTGVQSRGKQKLKRGGIFYTPQSGIWQTVWLESVPSVHVKDMKITPDIDAGEVLFEIFPSETNAHLSGEIIIVSDGAEATRAAFENGVCRIKMESFTLWSPENPYLYDVIIHSGNDTVYSYFGMRRHGIGYDKHGKMRIMLNNKPYFHNGVLDQGYYSDGLYTPPVDRALYDDIKAMKDLGFNMLRKHIKIEPMRWYYYCDKLGMLVWQDMINGGGACNTPLNGVRGFLNIKTKDGKYRRMGRGDEAGRLEYYEDTKRTVSALYNAVSLAVWVPFNESWGQFDALKAYSFVKALDNTRIIDHASGWHDQGGGDFKSLHIYFRPVTIPKREKRVIALSEFGGYSVPLKGHVYDENKTFGYRKYDTLEAFQKAYEALYENSIIPLIKKGLSATVYTQLSDVEDEINGLLTYDRAVVKVNKERTRAINKKLVLE